MADFAQEVIDAQAHEIGILSSQIIVANLRLNKSEAEIAGLNTQTEGLKARVIAQEADIKELRAQVAPKNHPSKKVKAK
jgi:predicted  nucleic acid-binding Zn-ribbon protein